LHTGDRSAATIDAGGVLPGYTGVIVRDGYAGYTNLVAHLGRLLACAPRPDNSVTVVLNLTLPVPTLDGIDDLNAVAVVLAGDGQEKDVPVSPTSSSPARSGPWRPTRWQQPSARPGSRSLPPDRSASTGRRCSPRLCTTMTSPCH
jgi:hypothetical protein